MQQINKELHKAHFPIWYDVYVNRQQRKYNHVQPVMDKFVMVRYSITFTW